LAIVLFLFKTVSSIDLAKLSGVLPEDGDRIQSPKRILNKSRIMDNVQKYTLGSCEM
jgi:hypothetical protein